VKNNLDLLLNDRTSPIWKSFRFKYKIELIPEYDYSINIIERKFKRNKVSIYYNIYDPRPDHFAHEILHILVHKEGFVITKIIDQYVWNYPRVCEVWDRDFRNLIGNIIDHDKMYPKYLELGFEKSEFVGDYYERKCSVEEIRSEVELNFHPNISTLKYITAKYFLIKGTFDLSIDYTEDLKLLSELSPNLYFILDSFWTSLLNLSPQYSRKNQESIVMEFFKNLEIEYLKVD
jgi:hypothetical protein